MFRIYVRTLRFLFSFLMSFLGCLFTHFRPRDILRIFVVVVVVFNYIKYAFISTRIGLSLKKGNRFLDENQVVQIV